MRIPQVDRVWVPSNASAVEEFERSENAWNKAIRRKERVGQELSSKEKGEFRSVVMRVNGLSLSMYPNCKSCWSRDINAGCNFTYGSSTCARANTTSVRSTCGVRVTTANLRISNMLV